MNYTLCIVIFTKSEIFKVLTLSESHVESKLQWCILWGLCWCQQLSLETILSTLNGKRLSGNFKKKWYYLCNTLSKCKANLFSYCSYCNKDEAHIYLIYVPAHFWRVTFSTYLLITAFSAPVIVQEISPFH